MPLFAAFELFQSGLPTFHFRGEPGCASQLCQAFLQLISEALQMENIVARIVELSGR